MNMADNQMRCSVCGRVKPRNPTRAQAALHDLGEQLDDAVIAKQQWTRAYHAARRNQQTSRAVEARDEMDDWNNEITRLTYYIELCQQQIDREAKLK